VGRVRPTGRGAAVFRDLDDRGAEGEVLARAPEEGTGVWSAELDPSELRRVRAILPALEHRRLGITC